MSALFVFLVLAVLIFFPSLNGVFIADDIQNIATNPSLLAGDAGRFWREPFYGFYIPVTYTVWTWLHALSAEPWIFHAFNIVLHALNAGLVFLVALRLKLSRRGAWLAALFFLAHPLQAETVAWISGGRDILSAFFGLCALLSALNARTRGMVVASAAAYMSSVLAKPALLLLPVAFWLIQHPLSRPQRVCVALWSVCAVTAGAGAMWIQSGFALTHSPAGALWKQPLQAADALGFYTAKFFLPFPLSADYGHAAVGAGAALCALGLLAFLTFIIAPRLRESRTAAGFYALMILPVLGLIPFAGQTQSWVADRYIYFPLLGLALGLGRLCANRSVAVVTGALLVVFLPLTFEHAGSWRSKRAWAEDILENNPESYGALNTLGTLELENGNLATAEDLLKRARDLEPRQAVAWSNLGLVYWQTKNTEAIFRQIDPPLTDPSFLQYNAGEAQALALMFRMSARAHFTMRETEQAREAYCRAAALDPRDADLAGELRVFLEQNGGGC